MKVLVIWAHPLPDSFSAALCRTAVEALGAGGHETRLVDLYAEGFDPVLDRAGRLAYHDITANTLGVEEHIARLRWAEALVFVYPTWNFGLPAILKGWFDRVLLPGVAFTIEAGAIRPGLTHIRRLACVTSYGGKRWFVRFMVGDPARKLVARGLRRLCAPGVRVDWLALYDMNAARPERYAAFQRRVAAVLGAW